jgi:hypothetical protein
MLIATPAILFWRPVFSSGITVKASVNYMMSEEKRYKSATQQR